MAKGNPDWFCEALDVNKTKAITEEQVNKDRLEGMDEDLIQQEYYVSFEGSIHGSYYGKQFRELRAKNRLVRALYEIGLPVHTAWDLGVGDSTVVWFFQSYGSEIRVIDCYEATGEGLAHYVKVLKDRGYIYKDHYAPHDIKVRELGSGKSRYEIARELEINFTIIPNLPVEDGIDAVRRILPNCWFDEETCKKGISALEGYHKEYDEVRKTFKPNPLHDWCSHYADAFRMLALGRQDIGAESKLEEPHPWNENRIRTEYNPLNPFEM